VAREKEKTRRPLRFVGIARSGASDTAERHEDLMFAGLDPHSGASAAQARRANRPRSRRTPPGRRTST
jgi:hypothetical protein